MAREITVDVPDEVKAVLDARAARAGLTLQEYLVQQLASVATRPDVADAVAIARTRVQSGSRPTLDGVLDRAGGRAGGSVPIAVAAAAVRDDRAGR